MLTINLLVINGLDNVKFIAKLALELQQYRGRESYPSHQLPDHLPEDYIMSLFNANQNASQSQASVPSISAPSTATIVSATATLNEQLELLGEKLGEFKAYDSQLAIPEIEGTRVAKLLYQVNKQTGKKVAESSYVRLPTKHLTEEVVVARISELSPYVLSWLQELETVAIKEEHKKGSLSCFTEYLSLDRIIERLEESEAGSRLNKEKIEAWFNADIMDSLAVLFAAKMGLDESASESQLVKIEMVIKAYRAKFASLASPKTYLKEADCIAMISVVRNCKQDTSLLGSRFIARLGKMQEKEDEVLLAL